MPPGPGGSEGSIDGGGTGAGPDTLDYAPVAGASYSVAGTGPAHGFQGSATALGSFQNIAESIMSADRRRAAPRRAAARAGR